MVIDMKDLYDIFKYYWRAYGGIKALCLSPYLHLSIVFTLGCYPIWLTGLECNSWYDISINVMPNILGFTLGGYAILLAFGNERFLNVIAGQDEDERGEPSPFIEVNASFIHFILCQVLSIILALFGLVWEIDTGFFAGISFLVFIYALTTALAAAFAILRLAKCFDLFVTSQQDEDSDE